MVGAFDTHHRKFTGGCNSSCYQTGMQTYADYTLEARRCAAVETASLTKIEGKGPRSFDREELSAIDDLLRLFL